MSAECEFSTVIFSNKETTIYISDDPKVIIKKSSFNNCLPEAVYLQHLKNISGIPQLLELRALDFDLLLYMPRLREILPPYLGNYRKTFGQLANTLYGAHQAGVIHRDITPANIMFGFDDQPYLIDWGHACFCDPRDTLKIRGLCSTLWYRAPEVILGEPYDGKIDVWALGTVMLRNLLLYPQFQGNNPLDQLLQIYQFCGIDDGILCYPGNRTKIIPSDDPLLQNLLLGMLEFDPEKRMTMRDVVNHPYFAVSMPSFVASEVWSSSIIYQPITDEITRTNLQILYSYCFNNKHHPQVFFLVYQWFHGRPAVQQDQKVLQGFYQLAMSLVEHSMTSPKEVIGSIEKYGFNFDLITPLQRLNYISVPPEKYWHYAMNFARRLLEIERETTFSQIVSEISPDENQNFFYVRAIKRFEENHQHLLSGGRKYKFGNQTCRWVPAREKFDEPGYLLYHKLKRIYPRVKVYYKNKD